MPNKISKEFIYKEYKCFVVELVAGHRCGYVEIPEGNLFFKKEYSDKVPVKKEFLDDKPIGKRSPIDILCNSDIKEGDDLEAGFLFDVHGGITYSRDHLLERTGGWYFGFDCAHCDDGKDVTIMDDEHKEMTARYPFLNEGVIRTEEYVIEELKNLVDQIIDINNLYNK